MGINYTVKFNGEVKNVRRKHYESVEQFEAVAEDMILHGMYNGELCEKYDLNTHYGNLIANTFRDGGGQLYLLKRIIEDDLTPHPEFFDTEVGRNVKALLPLYEPQKKMVRKAPKSEIDQIVDDMKALLDDLAAAIAVKR